MALTLSTKFKKFLDMAVPLSVGPSPYRRFSDFFADFVTPVQAVAEGAFVVPAAAGGLAVDVSSGFIRNAAGVIKEVKAAVTQGTLTAPVTAGHAIVYLVSADVNGALVFTAGVDALAAAAVAPATPSGNTALATVKILTAETAPAGSRVDNTVRKM